MIRFFQTLWLGLVHILTVLPTVVRHNAWVAVPLFFLACAVVFGLLAKRDK